MLLICCPSTQIYASLTFFHFGKNTGSKVALHIALHVEFISLIIFHKLYNIILSSKLLASDTPRKQPP